MPGKVLSRGLLLCSGLWASLLLTGCSAEATESPPLSEQAAAECSPAQPPADQRAVDPRAGFWLKPTKPQVRRGELISFTVEGAIPSGRTLIRGESSDLECWTGDGWKPQYRLFTGIPPHANPYPLEVQRVPDVALPGPGPEPIQIPRDLPNGWYRLKKSILFGAPARREHVTVFGYVRIRGG